MQFAHNQVVRPNTSIETLQPQLSRTRAMRAGVTVEPPATSGAHTYPPNDTGTWVYGKTWEFISQF